MEVISMILKRYQIKNEDLEFIDKYFNLQIAQAKLEAEIDLLHKQMDNFNKRNL